MLIVPPPKYPRKNRLLSTASTATPVPPTPLVMNSATYNNGAAILTLVFNQDVSVAGFDGEVVTVEDGVYNERVYKSASASVSGATVTIILQELSEVHGDDVFLTAFSGNGITAVNGGAMWEGVDGLVLPYP